MVGKTAIYEKTAHRRPHTALNQRIFSYFDITYIKCPNCVISLQNIFFQVHALMLITLIF